MSIELKQLDTDEILRYMGCPPDQAGADLRNQAQLCGRHICQTARLRWAWRCYDILQEENGVRLSCGLLLPGRDLKAHLEGCVRAVVFCMTLGAAVDVLIRKTQSGDMLQGLALDCAADTAVEQGCDQIELELQAMFPGCSFPFRYSPGYGDLPLTVQGELLSLLDAPLRVGLTASASHILIPRKSVTAILGVSDREIARNKRSCLGCPAQGGCQYRKAGGHCGLL